MKLLIESMKVENNLKLNVGQPFIFYCGGRKYCKPFKHTGPIIELGAEPLWHQLLVKLTKKGK